jgi:type II secretory pathway pseudopilin PulG
LALGSGLKAPPDGADIDHMPEAPLPRSHPGVSPTPGPRPQARPRRFAGAEAGFTLVEMLASMVAALVLAGALMTFLVSSLRTQNGISSRSVSVRQAEVGFAQLTRDLREAQNIPDAGKTLGNGTSLVHDDTPVVITYTATTFTATFYLPPTGGASPPTAGTQVTWSCTAASGTTYGSCTRQQGATTATEITGVTSAAITPTASDGTTIATATLTGPAGSQLATPPGSPPQYPSYVSVKVNVIPISQSDTTRTTAVAGSTAVSLEAAVNLRAWS